MIAALDPSQSADTLTRASELLTSENNEFKWSSLIGSGYASIGAAASVGISSGARGSLTVQTKAQKLVVESADTPGGPWSEESRPTWETGDTRFRSFCAGMLTD